MIELHRMGAEFFAEDLEWAGKELESLIRGGVTYSAIHAWVDGGSLCGTREPAGYWINEKDSGGELCKRCVAKSSVLRWAPC